MDSTKIVHKYPIKNSIYKSSPAVSDDMTRIAALLLNRDYAENSRAAIKADLKAFVVWFSEKTGESFRFQRITQRDVADFRDDSRKKGLAVKTINRRLISLRLFLDVAVEEGLIQKNPAKGIKQLSGQLLASQSLSSQETRRLLREIDIRGNLRDKLLIELMLGAGLRLSEAVHLELKDIQLSERKGLVTIQRAKGGKERKIPLHPNIRSLLASYIEKKKPTGRLFSGQRGNLTTIGAHFIVKKYGAKAGLPHLHAHTLRHAFAMNYLRANPGSIQTLSQLMGHSSIQTTCIYLQHTVEQLEEGIEKMAY